MTWEKITTIISKDPWYRNKVHSILKYNGSKMGYDNVKYVDDLYQDIFIILWNNKEDLINSYNNNKLRQYYNGILYNQVISKSSPFYLKYRKKSILNGEINDNFDIEDEGSDIYKGDFDIKKWCIDKKLFDWYESEIFNLYFRTGSSFIIDDISERVSYNRIAKELNSTYNKVYRRVSIIKFKIFWSIINDRNISGDVKLGDNEVGMTFMINYIEKFKKKNRNYDKWIK